MKDELFNLLAKSSFGEILSDDDLGVLADSFSMVKYRLGQEICHIGDRADAFYIIYSGKARVLGLDLKGDEVTLDMLSAGAHIGEEEILSGEPWSYSVRASSDLVVMKMERRDFLAFLEANHDLKNFFASFTSERSVSSLIRQCLVFVSLSPEELKKFVGSFKPESFEKGDFIVREGDEGDALYVIRTGEVEVFRGSSGNRVINRLSQGDFFGELALLTKEKRAATVKAATPVTVFRLDKEDFDRLVTAVPQVKDAMLGIAAGYSSEIRKKVKPDSEAFEGQDGFAEEEREEQDYEPKRARRFPLIYQQGEADCGAACLAMVLKYYGHNISINRIREMANVTRDGATMYSLAAAAENFGMQARGMEVGFGDFRQLKLPVIVHWEGNHYVVVHRIKRDIVYIADPGVGQRKLSGEEFQKGWTGKVLTLTPTADMKKISSSRSTFAHFLPFVTAHRGVLLNVLFASLVIQALGLAIPLFTQNIVDRVLLRGDFGILNLMLIGMLIITFFQAGMITVREYLFIVSIREIDLAMMIRFYSHLLGLPLKYFEDRKVGDILTRVQDNERIRELLTGTTLSLIMDTLTVLVFLSLMVYINLQLTMVVIFFIPVFAIFVISFTPLMKKASREMLQANGEAQAYLVQSVSGIGTVKALAVERQVRWNWEDRLQKLLTVRQRGQVLSSLAGSGAMILQTLATAIILWYGAWLALQGSISIGQLMAFNILLGSVITPVVRTVGIWDQFQEARIALERVNDVLESQLEKSSSKKIVMPSIKGHLIFKNVSFKYDQSDNYVLQDINLEITPGQTVALVGRSGAGKSTLANLLLGLYHPNKGEIIIDDTNICFVEPDSLRRQIGVVLQDGFLFSGTITENIAFGYPDAPFRDVNVAAMLAGAHDFIMELPQGYETLVGERGMNLSGGQRQRLTIARALFLNPRILILDEATSALDTESEKAVQHSLSTILKDRTTILIAHRLSTIRNADLIVVLEKGVIFEMGTHTELMEKKGLYHYLNSQQLKG